MAKKKVSLTSVPNQVRIALDGRTQRWLALEIKMPEAVLSKKMKGTEPFTKDEVSAINARLSCNIEMILP